MNILEILFVLCFYGAIALVLLFAFLRQKTATIKVSQILFAVFFWGFNAVLLLIAYVGLLPFLSLDLMRDALNGTLPLDFLIPFIGLVGVPTTCTVVSLVKPKTRFPSLFPLFYGVEMPLLMVCFLRFFVLRELNPATMLLLLSGFLAIAAHLEKLFRPDQPVTNSLLWLRTIGHGLMIVTALYLLAITAFFVLPTSWSILSNPWVLVYAAIAAPISLLVVGFMSFPFGMGYVYLRQGYLQWQEFAARQGDLKTLGLAVSMAVIWISSLVLLQAQPQQQAFQLLATPPQTAQERQALLKQSGLIRQGLLNAYLYRYRYLAPQQEFNTVFYLYGGNSLESMATPTPRGIARELQNAFNFLISPFLYQGQAGDNDKAAQLYAQFFDTPILRAEPKAIEHALESTFERTSAKAGLMNVNQRKVWLAQQDLAVTPQGDWADVEIHEVYENQTSEQQEVLYYFSLPESAVLTGVWLGENNRKLFEYVVSPRGAAQQVYSNEVTRRVDPALLEQVGPRNYRLRAFPILPRGETPMHLWLSYKVMQQPDGGWSLPQLHEQRNIFWSAFTRRTQNGKAVSNPDGWLPPQVTTKPTTPVSHQVTLASGDQIVAQPLAAGKTPVPTGKRFAVILDGSRSMDQHRTAVAETLGWIKSQLLANNQVDLYLTSAVGMAPQRVENLQSFDPALTFYGTLQPKEMLAQFLQLRQQRDYDALFVITDPGTYELSDDRPFKAKLPAPVWFVHLGGFQPAYDDDTLQAIQDSGGGVAEQLPAVVERLTTQADLGPSLINWVDGYAWYRGSETTATGTTAVAKAGLTPIAARQWIQSRSRELQPNALKELDGIHAIAKEYRIVTPYSSMIVLVNDRQRQDLKHAEQQGDRFDREVEDQQITNPQGNLLGMDNVAGVPEPAEWLLLILGGTALGLLSGREVYARVMRIVLLSSGEYGSSLNGSFSSREHL